MLVRSIWLPLAILVRLDCLRLQNKIFFYHLDFFSNNRKLKCNVQNENTNVNGKTNCTKKYNRKKRSKNLVPFPVINKENSIYKAKIDKFFFAQANETNLL